MYKLDLIENLGRIQVWRVDGNKIRDTAEIEFTDFGQHYAFPNLIPEYEFWIDQEASDDETQFYVDHMKVEWKLMRQGMSYTQAHAIANRKEKSVRAKVARAPLGQSSQVNPHLVALSYNLNTDVTIWLVDGQQVRAKLFIDFTEGGHDLVYRFIPAREIWIDNDVEESERPYIILHESVERDLMEHGESYLAAHRQASQIEYRERQFDPARESLKENLMNIDPSLAQMLQDQMNRERYNAACYEQLSLSLENLAWDGFAHWMHEAGKEELKHARKFAHFLIDRNVEPILTEIGRPPLPSDAPEAFRLAMQVEIATTAFIRELAEAAENADDEDTELWLAWALEEQRRSERELKDILMKLERAQGNYAALLQLDKELGK